ncbi:hypothetical protein JRI60_38045 [Archangium violaceum]|uniref:hypothetical protein n=1 Tax=Archangium violaceum TaxID=83451 RepID=UPI00194EBA91|nr:hypothetical protein [Archangium violaceum]QRN94867.1 hypothetical protein JRI60_38045 [Archangium violaceum]
MRRQPSSSVFFDESLWPLLVVRFSGEVSQAQTDEFLRGSELSLRRGERHVCILDARLARGQSLPNRRKQHIGWLEAYESPLRALTMGCAFIFPSPFFLLSMRAFLHVKPLPVPYFVAPGLHEAVGWAAGRLEAEGLSLHARRVRAHFKLQGCYAERSTG